MTRRTAIVDTNVVVAGLLTGDASSPTARILDGMIAGSFVFVLSPALLAEYRAVLLRGEIRRLHRLHPDEVDEVLAAIVVNAIVRDVEPSGEPAPDPGDQHLWDLLGSVPGGVLVTGDSMLLEGAPDGASVLSPRAWIETLDS